MPLSQHSAEESAFMKGLLMDLDDSFSIQSQTPLKLRPHHRSPKKSPCNPRLLSPCKNSLHKAPKTPLTRKVHPPTPNASLSEELGDFLEGAEDWILDDWVPSPVKPVMKTPLIMAPIQPSSVKPSQEPCTRCVVLLAVDEHAGNIWQKSLTVKNEATQDKLSVLLRDDWMLTDVRAGDIVHVIGEFTQPSPSSPLLSHSSSSNVNTQELPYIIVNSKLNLLVLFPDNLITATSLSNAQQCVRKPILSSLIHSTSATSDTSAMVWGNMLHSVLQSCMKEDKWDEQAIDHKIEETVTDGLEHLVRTKMTVEQAKKEVKARASGIKAFSERYMSKIPKSIGVLSNAHTSKKNGSQSLLAITDLLDIEEDIWSPRYGLKGKIDASIQTAISVIPPQNIKTQVLKTSPRLIESPKPFEIKTGRSVAGMEHRAQTMLYSLMMAERYGISVDTSRVNESESSAHVSGLLYYTQSEEVVEVSLGRNELRGLMCKRNEMVAVVARRYPRGSGQGGSLESVNPEDLVSTLLPATIDNERSCQRCYVLDTCMLYRRAVENVKDNSSPIADIYAQKMGHLTDSQAGFFKKWENLISLEEQDLGKFRKELWCLGAKEREAKGRCFGGMMLDERYKNEATTGTRIHQFTYRFTRHSVYAINGAIPSLLSGFMSVGDAITLSVEPHLLALARGFIVDLTPQEVVVGVDHEVCLKQIRRRLIPFEHSRDEDIIFRIDKDELYGGMSRIRNNLAQLFYADGDTKRLKLVVDLDSPQFDNDFEMVCSSPRTRREEVLNPNQLIALQKALTAQDYALILGMPGTGKTTLIVSIIRRLVTAGKTVLIASYTHSAVDNILLKLTKEDFVPLRLGNTDKVHPGVQQFTLTGRRKPSTTAELEQQIMTPPVVATTCLSLDHVLFSRRKFDYCIVDEASQITLPTCLGPLRFADKFILVGDHFQLPPLVKNPAARKGGLDVSLFRRLSDAHPHAVVDLTYQYRMNADIMLLSNKLIYSDRLKCGSEAVAKQTLKLPTRSFLREITCKTSCYNSGCWLEKLMDESCRAVFVDTDLLPARDSRVGDLVQNETEANLVYQTTETLIRSGVLADQIGIISLYRQQIKLLTDLLQNRPAIEILTADRSQGRDKDCIIISMVRSNEEGQIGDLVKDWRRMNVSFTRARSKLIVFGSRKTLQEAALLKEFFALMDGQGWILQLPPKADVFHASNFSKKSPKKRTVDNSEKENIAPEPQKKRTKSCKSVSEENIIKQRPLLRDLAHEIIEIY